MDKYSDNDKLDKEILEFSTKINDLNKGYTKTIHDFAKGII